MPVDKEKLERAFNPRTVAVVGDKAARDYMWLRSMSTLKGRLYSVQIDEQELEGIAALGVPNYPSILDIPGPVDYVLVSVPRAASPRIVGDCIAKGVGGVALFTSGFAETSTEEGTRLERTLAEMACQAGLALIGPNCMGIFNPSVGLRFSTQQYVGEPGPMSLISQSGSLVGAIVTGAYVEGVRVNKVVSYGNAIAVDEVDYLEYFASDQKTKVICVYIEGLRRGRAFFDCLRQITPQKPVIILKGGQTDAGTRATASHTGALAESMQIWEVALRQCGATKVDSLEEMTDAIQAFSYLPPATGTGVALTGGAGGQSVTMTDAFERAGLRVPALSEASYKKLASFFVLVGASYSNPIDMGQNRRYFNDILRILAEDENIDIIAMQVWLGGFRRNRPIAEAQQKALAEISEATGIPALAILFSPSILQDAEEARIIKDQLRALGIPSFLGYDRAARALKKVVDYYRFRESIGS